ncbi:glutaredoxin domain-containing cysteine-rich protein 2 [Geothlypis trichas]
MEEPQPQHEGRPRRVRFRISSAGSGRLLKQVYEDGQELEPPAEERSRRFLRNSFEPEEPLCGPGELPGSADSLCWPTALTARRISVLRESQHQGLLGSAGLLRDCRAGPGLCGVSAVRTLPACAGLCGVSAVRTPANLCRANTAHGYGYTDNFLLQPSPVVDFGKIIIYTNNLKIIRAPMDEKELMRRIIQTEGMNDWTFVYREKKERLSGGHERDVENMVTCNQHLQLQEIDAEHGCSQCKGSGCAPCSLCHGSKFSMLANRFWESYRALRCPACDESGLQPCRVSDVSAALTPVLPLRP